MLTCDTPTPPPREEPPEYAIPVAVNTTGIDTLGYVAHGNSDNDVDDRALPSVEQPMIPSECPQRRQNPTRIHNARGSYLPELDRNVSTTDSTSSSESAGDVQEIQGTLPEAGESSFNTPTTIPCGSVLRGNPVSGTDHRHSAASTGSANLEEYEDVDPRNRPHAVPTPVTAIALPVDGDDQYVGVATLRKALWGST